MTTTNLDAKVIIVENGKEYNEIGLELYDYAKEHNIVRSYAEYVWDEEYDMWIEVFFSNQDTLWSPLLNRHYRVYDNWDVNAEEYPPFKIKIVVLEDNGEYYNSMIPVYAKAWHL